jgi:methyl-accepting chemotaxis protein
MATLDELIVRITGDTKQLRQELDKSVTITKTSSTKMKRAFDSIGSTLKKITDKVFSFRGALTLAAGATGIGLLVQRQIGLADNIAKTADKLGVGIEALQEYRFAADQAGIAQTTFDMAIQRFGRRAGEASKGVGEAKDALKELGIQLTDTNGKTRKIEDMLLDVADAMTKVENPTDRLRLAFKLFDSEGVAMVRNSGSKPRNWGSS